MAPESNCGMPWGARAWEFLDLDGRVRDKPVPPLRHHLAPRAPFMAQRRHFSASGYFRRVLRDLWHTDGFQRARQQTGLSASTDCISAAAACSREGGAITDSAVLQRLFNAEVVLFAPQ